MTDVRVPILPADIRKGDTIRCEYSTPHHPSAHEYVAIKDTEEWTYGGSYFLLSRPVPPVVLPTEPGIYVDMDGAPWVVDERGLISYKGISAVGWAASEYAPFTRLRPEAEVAAEVLADIKTVYGENYLDNSNADWNDVAVKWAAK